MNITEFQALPWKMTSGDFILEGIRASQYKELCEFLNTLKVGFFANYGARPDTRDLVLPVSQAHRGKIRIEAKA